MSKEVVPANKTMNIFLIANNVEQYSRKLIYVNATCTLFGGQCHASVHMFSYETILFLQQLRVNVSVST